MTHGSNEFRIIIVGGGIAGLATGIALRGPNRSITILERSRMLKETGALISLQPNASKIVTKWGLDPFLLFAEPQVDRGFRLFDVAGQLAKEVPLRTEQFGADRILYHRQDLHSALRNAAVSPEREGKPVDIRTASPVVACDAENATVTLADGDVLQADLVIGADGIKSVVRTAVLGEERKAVPTGISAYRILIPTDSIQSIDGVPDSVKTPEPAMTSMVVGNDKRVIMGPGRGGKLFGIVALVPDKQLGEEAADDSWVKPGSKTQLLEAYSDFPQWLRAIFQSAPDAGIGLWQLRDLAPLPTWVRGRTIIIGDAAHAMLPTQGQGASQSIEDAEALQAFLAGVHGRPNEEEIKTALHRVFHARYGRCRNCWLRDEDCETTDPRYPEKGPSVRRWATKDGLLPGQNPAATHRNQAQIPKHSQAESATASLDPDRRLSPTANSIPHGSGSVRTEASAPEENAIPSSADTNPPQGTMSWVSRGYQTSVNADGGHVNNEDNEPDLVVNADASKVKYMGGSSVQCLSVFVNIYLRRKGLPTFSSHFRSGMQHVEEFPLSLTTCIPPLPPQETLATCLDTFFTKVWPVYPVLERQTIEASIQFFQGLEASSSAGLQATMASSQVPQLAIIFAVTAIAADETAGEPTELGNLYVSAAYSLFAHLVATPYMTSVQALLLLAVALRCRFKDGQAWHVLAQAIRVAHSIGLHRYIPPQLTSTTATDQPPGGLQTKTQLQARVWWSCYALEKLMELETGRPSAIQDDGVDQILPQKADAADDAPDVFSFWIDLARILGQISRHLYRQHPTSAEQLMFEVGRLDQRLTQWANSLPENLKPGHELLGSHDAVQPHISTFLSLQYHHAQITLLRVSLVFPTQSFIDEVKRVGPNIPSYARLVQSENISTAAARATVRQVLELADHGIHSLIPSVTQLFLAVVVLALHVVKNPNKRLVRSDLELLITATEHLETLYIRGGQHSDFARGFQTLRTSVLAATNLEQGAINRRSTPASDPELSTEYLFGENRDSSSLARDSSLLVPAITPDPTSFGLNDNIPFEELWGAIGSYSLFEPTFDYPSLHHSH
ncbi:hypothetical protein ABEF91_000879 [Exophiala dermatitidis]